jgi:hypothetical protein
MGAMRKAGLSPPGQSGVSSDPLPGQRLLPGRGRKAETPAAHACDPATPAVRRRQRRLIDIQIATPGRSAPRNLWFDFQHRQRYRVLRFSSAYPGVRS